LISIHESGESRNGENEGMRKNKRIEAFLGAGTRLLIERENKKEGKGIDNMQADLIPNG
jgi:hypothetical protein